MSTIEAYEYSEMTTSERCQCKLFERIAHALEQTTTPKLRPCEWTEAKGSDHVTLAALSEKGCGWFHALDYEGLCAVENEHGQMLHVRSYRVRFTDHDTEGDA